jgi:hypothetical protein
MLLKIVKHCIPEYIKNKKLDDLFRITAGAFECGIPELKGLSFEKRLHEYAVFTKVQAEKTLQSEGSIDERKMRVDAVEEKLYQNSFLLGQDLKKSLHVRTRAQAIEALEMIYRIIGIDLHIDGLAGCGKCGPDATKSDAADSVTPA